MKVLVVVMIIAVGVLLLVLALAVRIVKQYEQGMLFRLGRVRTINSHDNPPPGLAGP